MRLSACRQPERSGRISVAFATLLLIAACEQPATEQAAAETTPGDSAGYVGSASCAGCHAAETELWRDSHHDLAIQLPDAQAVLGDFTDSSFEHHGVRSRFYQRDGNYFVETDGPDGALAEFPVLYTFGVYPLQQYLLELPDGKIQALSIAWDTRTSEAGGQRWFHVYGDEPIDHTDVLHWTQPSQNWETQCADCHSTNLVSHYDIAADRFDTSWAELDVACEACHGPGKAHVAWAEDDQSETASNKGLQTDFASANAGGWIPDPDTGNSRRSPARTDNAELNSCAGCHSRRSRIAEGNHPATPFLDTYVPAFINPPLYHADGQILDEVYVYGSFLQSKMHMQGVTCSDCHNPHSLELKASGAGVCAQCHAPAKFSSVEHQLHAAGTVDCIDCHMPERNYMQIDARNDHSFRIPRPEISVTQGTPNTCTDCHADRDAQWAVAVLEQAGRLQETPHWTAALPLAGSGRQGIDLAAGMATDERLPDIIRASVAGRLTLGDTSASRELLAAIAADDAALVRLGAARAGENSQPTVTAAALSALLDDERRAVRITAAAELAGTDPVLLPAGSYTRLNAAISEYRESLLVNPERAETHVSLGNLAARQNDAAAAEDAYRTALQVNPDFVPAYANLADLYRATGREPECAQVLREGLAVAPGQPALLHSLGLSLVRQEQLDQALPYLQQAADSPEASPRFALVYALALEGNGEAEAASDYIDAALRRFPRDPQLTAVQAEIRARLSP